MRNEVTRFLEHDIQVASMWKRGAAFLLDLILVFIIFTGAWAGISEWMHFDDRLAEMDSITRSYADKHGIDLDKLYAPGFTQADVDEELSNRIKAADEEMAQDPEAVRLHDLLNNLKLLSITLSVLAAVLIVDLVIPLLLKNGQTVGKKVFSLCLIRNDGVKMNNLQLFTRTILGKYTVETMIPVYVLVMLSVGTADLLSLILVLVLAVVQICCLIFTRNNSALHDLMAGTTVVDMPSQRIFQSTEELVAYQKELAAERAARQIY